ncbi:MAG: DUF3592 domain-containing protein [Myxococcaceae bacterium]|nr:MAG: DUF3592 domain-containing protein [Myxococcaceae bacterium]
MGSTVAVLLQLGVFASFPLALWGWFIGRPYARTRRLRTRGALTKAQVLRAEYEPDDGDGYAYWTVEYVFTPPLGRQVRDTYRHQEKTSPMAGDVLELRYLPEDPRKHLLVAQEPGLVPTVFWTCVTLLFVIPLVLIAVESLQQGLD